MEKWHFSRLIAFLLAAVLKLQCSVSDSLSGPQPVFSLQRLTGPVSHCSSFMHNCGRVQTVRGNGEGRQYHEQINCCVCCLPMKWWVLPWIMYQPAVLTMQQMSLVCTLLIHLINSFHLIITYYLCPCHTVSFKRIAVGICKGQTCADPLSPSYVKTFLYLLLRTSRWHVKQLWQVYH